MVEMLEELKERLRRAVDKLLGKAVVDEKLIKEVVREIQRGLLLSDVNVKLVLDLSRRIERRALSERPPPGVSTRDYVLKIIYDELTGILGRERQRVEVGDRRPFKILLVGLQGSGKTTTAAKLAMYFSGRGYRVGVFSVDTYRPAGREQLRQLCEELRRRGCSVEFFDAPLDDAVRLAEEGLRRFDGRADVVIIDTAGRHKDEEALMREVRELEAAIRPDLTLLVIDGSIGQQAYSQARAFGEAVRVGGIIVTKLDGTARGGGALSAAAATGAKIYFIGVGEKVEDLEEYNPPGLVGRLLGIGDMQSLLERFRAIELSRERQERLMKIAKGRFTLVDMINQIEELRRLGTLSKLLEHLPGFSLKIPKEVVREAERKIEMWRAALSSMTDEEKVNPSIIKGSRLRRISRGSGVDERVIKEMIRQYNMVKRLMRSARGRRLMKLLGEDFLKRGIGA